jgi:uroporphyrin-III C-methyltransferase/precorrin-2 dehydrogenase/sirohydrochlorin ferrochelatase
MRHLPIFVDTRGQRIVVSGAGRAAIAKLRTLLKSEARIDVYSLHASDTVLNWAAQGTIYLHLRLIEGADIATARLVYAANDDAIENSRVAALAKQQGILLNVADDLVRSAFISPALVDRDPVVVAIGTGGASPVLARAIKSMFEELLSPNLGRMARFALQLRPQAKRLVTTNEKRTFWRWLFGGAGERLLNERGALGARRAAREVLLDIDRQSPPSGTVALVGAGPGDPALLTLQARTLIEEADVVLHDRLVDSRILDLARREAQIVEVGKMPGGPAWTQQAINREMVKHAAEGSVVVRLKSGDPMTFGRADEELDALQAHHIAYQVVPGISAATAAASRIGASLTQRGRNSAITFLTGQDTKGYAEQDWRALANNNCVFAVYMGVRAARFVQGRLLLHGRTGATPVTIVVNVSRPDEAVITGELSRLGALVEEHTIEGPAIIYIGLRARTTYVPKSTGALARDLAPAQRIHL